MISQNYLCSQRLECIFWSESRVILIYHIFWSLTKYTKYKIMAISCKPVESQKEMISRKIYVAEIF